MENLAYFAAASIVAYLAFYSLKRARPSKGGGNPGNWLAFALALAAGLLLYGTFIGDLVRMLRGWGLILIGVALLVAIVIYFFDLYQDRKPDKPAIIASLLLPSILIAGGVNGLAELKDHATDPARQITSTVGE